MTAQICDPKLHENTADDEYMYRQELSRNPSTINLVTTAKAGQALFRMLKSSKTMSSKNELKFLDNLVGMLKLSGKSKIQNFEKT